MTLLLVSFFSSLSIACSSFFMEGAEDIHLAKSYDWKIGSGFIAANYKNVLKENLSLAPKLPKIRWKSEFSSLTFNQYGKEFPLGGMNEKGLAIEILWDEKVKDTDFPTPGKKAVFNELQWIQYGLDKATNIRELEELTSRIDIIPLFAMIHYLACDANKECVILEHSGGEQKFIKQNNLPHRFLTNTPYEESVNFLKKFVGFGGNEKPLERGTESKERFVTIGHQLTKLKKENAISFALDTLNRVKQESSKWNIIYGLKSGTIHFRPTDSQKVSVFSSVLFSKTMDCRKDESQKVARLVSDKKMALEEFTHDLNAEVLEESIRETAPKLDARIVEAAAHFPSKLKCDMR